MQTLHTANSIIESRESHCVSDTRFSQSQAGSIRELDLVQTKIVSEHWGISWPLIPWERAGCGRFVLKKQ